MNFKIGDIIILKSCMQEHEILNIVNNLVRISNGNYIRWVETSEIKKIFCGVVGEVKYTKTFFGGIKRKVIYN